MLGKRGNIVWLASYPKSGNTWFRVFLENLLSKSDHPVHINELNNSPIASSRIIFDDYSGIPSSDLTEEEILRIKPCVFRQMSSEAKDLIFLKVHDAWSLNPDNKPVFPEEATRAVIYIIRNPLDVVVSLAHHNNSDVKKSVENLNNPEYAFCMKQDKLYNQLGQPLLNWSKHVISWTRRSHLPIYIMRYEDMVDEPFKTFSGALNFLGMEYTEARIKSAIHYSSFNILKEQEIKDGFKEKSQRSGSFFRLGEKESWKTFLDEDSVKSIYNVHGKIMKQFGYFSELSNKYKF